MRIAIYGGAFDPPHVSHVLAVQLALATANVDEVWVIPCWKHSFGKEMSTFKHRLQMCFRAFVPHLDRRVKVMDTEGVIHSRYTYELLEHLISRYPEHQFTLIIGEDEHRDFDDWHRAKEIRSTVRIFTVGRVGVENSTFDPENPCRLPAVSSSNIRNRLALTKPEFHREIIQGLVPLSVVDYIEQAGLYPTQER